MANYGAKATRPGSDTSTADSKDMVLKSTFPTLKIHSQGVGSVSWTVALGSADGQEYKQVTITHNLGYRPISYFYYKNKKPGCNKWFLAPCMAPGADAATPPSEGYYAGVSFDFHSSDPTNKLQAFFNPSLDEVGNSVSFDYKYFICIDPER